MNNSASQRTNASRGRIRRENEARILEAAERVFAETGLAGATMAQIAQAAGLPKANLHYYFGTKEQLYQAVLTAILELWLDATDAMLPNSDPSKRSPAMSAPRCAIPAPAPLPPECSPTNC